MEANQTVADAVVENSFTNTLNQMCDGEVASQLSAELTRIVCAVQETGNPGELIFKMRVKPASAGVSALVVAADISVKLPKEDKPSSLFFSDKEGRLLRENPAQLKLPYRVVAEEKRAAAIEIAADPAPEVRQVS